MSHRGDGWDRCPLWTSVEGWDPLLSCRSQGLLWMKHLKNTIGRGTFFENLRCPPPALVVPGKGKIFEFQKNSG